MSRYTHIESLTFGQTSLPLPLSVRLSRKAEAIPAVSDSDAFATSIQTSVPTLVAEVRIRGTATAEDLSLGQQENLSFTVAATDSGTSSRTITLTDAVLTAVELAYEQSEMATVLLRFVAEAGDGNQDPFSAENAQ
jgi:hypothetical protein